MENSIHRLEDKQFSASWKKICSANMSQPQQTGGFPFSLLNLCLVVKSYWDRTGRTVTKFKENIPREEWDLDLKLADAQAKTSNCPKQVCRKRNLSTTLRISKMVLMAFLHKTS